MSVRQYVKGLELNLKKAAPDIMFVGGIVLSAASVVMFCKKSKKGTPVAEQYVENLEELSEDRDDGIYDNREYRHAVIKETAKTAVELGKIYWIPTLMWSASTGLIIGSHCMLKDRNAALTAIATGLGVELKTLHQRIIERYGEEVDRELKYGTETKEIETKSIDKETGEEIVNKSTVPVTRGLGGHSLYARYFDDSCAGWVNNAEYNLEYLKAREAEANNRLRKDGYLFLNDVYEMLGMKKTKAGQYVGWSLNSPFGDGYVSFGIYNDACQGNRDFINGYQTVALLDFNVDGVILGAMPELDQFGNEIG